MTAQHIIRLRLALLLIIVMAATLRFYRLDTMPPGLYHDEAYNGLDALSLLAREEFPRFYEGWELYAQDAHAERPPQVTQWPVFFEGNYGREPLHVYLMALSIWIGGATPAAIRAVPAAAGVLAVLATYLATRALFPPNLKRPLQGELLPLISAFSLAVLYPALHFSRFGIRGMVMLPLISMAVYAFWRGWRASTGRKGSVWLSVAGFFIGLSLYTFAAARLFPLVFILFGIYLLLVDRSELLTRWRQLAVALLVSLLTAAPLLIFFARYPYFFVFRMAYVANRGRGVVEGAPLQTWLLNVGRVIGGLFWLGETHLRHNLPGRPFMDPLQSVLFIAGLIHIVRQRLRPEAVFLFLWFGVMLLPSILSGDAPHFGRLLGAAPPMAIFIAMGTIGVANFVAMRIDRPILIIPAAMLLTLPSLIITGYDYFGRYANHPELARDFYLADWQLGQYAAAQPAATTLYLSPSQEEMATIYFALANPDRLRSFNGQDGLIPAGIPNQPALYLIRPESEATLANLQRFFAGAGLTTGPADDGFIPVSVPADATRIPNPVTEVGDFAGVITLPGWSVVVAPDHLEVTLSWQAAAAPSLNYTAFVHLLDETGTLVAQNDRQPAGYPTADWRTGEVIVDTFRIVLPPKLPPGPYRVQTGFYDLPTLNRLGEPFELDTLLILE